MKKYVLTTLLISCFYFSYGQNAIRITGGNVKITGGSTIVLDNTDLINQGTLEVSTSTVRFTGTSSNFLESGGTAFYNLQLDKNAGQELSLLDDLFITNQLEFLADENVLVIDAFDLSIGASASVLGYSPNRYIVTGNTGQLVKQGLINFTFPVGYDTNTYNPLTLGQSGLVDAIGVRCLENVLDGGDSGAPLSSGVANVSWELSEEVIGGSNISVTAQWDGTDELTGFDRTDSGIMRYHDGDWDLPVNTMGAASGSDPYTRSVTMSDMGMISVGGAEWINRVQLAARIFLQGPFLGAQMTDHLRSKALIPLMEPYTGLGYVHQGRGGNETIAASVLNVTGDDAITDWVVIELRDKNDVSTVLETCSALLQRDGDIVGLDGISNVGLPVLDDDYFVAIRHRNHLGIRTPMAKSLQKASSTLYDFTTASTQAYGTHTMEELGNGIWGMWGGNATGDDRVRATGPPTINDYSNLLNYLGGSTNIIFDEYVRQDFNMDGNVRATGPPTINDYAKLLNILGGATRIITEQF